MSLSVLPTFHSKSFIVSCLTFRSIIHFEVIFLHGVRECSNFILLLVALKFSQHHLMKSFFFSIVYSCLHCCRLTDHECMNYFLNCNKKNFLTLHVKQL